MAKIPDDIENQLLTEYPGVPIETARSGALSAANIYSLKQVVGLAVSEVLVSKGGIEGPSIVLSMLPNNPELANELIKKHYDESGVGGYGVGY